MGCNTSVSVEQKIARREAAMVNARPEEPAGSELVVTKIIDATPSAEF